MAVALFGHPAPTDAFTTGVLSRSQACVAESLAFIGKLAQIAEFIREHGFYHILSGRTIRKRPKIMDEVSLIEVATDKSDICPIDLLLPSMRRRTRCNRRTRQYNLGVNPT
jgi:hypothetical protein